MREPAELLQSLGRLARGLSALFWLLPLALIAEVETARTALFFALGPWAFVPAVVLNAALLFALTQLRPFQPQERIWQNALTRSEALALIDTGLAPFVFWWHRFPTIPFYAMSVGLLALSNLLFLIQMNSTLKRLAAMIPDETVRTETNAFGSVNVWMLGAVFLGLATWFAAWRFPWLPWPMRRFLEAARDHGLWIVVYLTILPLAITMALVWKIKEVVFAGIFARR